MRRRETSINYTTISQDDRRYFAPRSDSERGREHDIPLHQRIVISPLRPLTAKEKVTNSVATTPSSDGQTRLAYILGVPLAPRCQRQWPQMDEVVEGRDLIARVEGNFAELTLEVGRRLSLNDHVIVVEWTCNYGDGRLYRNVSIAELQDGRAIKVTDYWGEPTTTPEWRQPLTARLHMPADGIWKDNQHLRHH